MKSTNALCTPQLGYAERRVYETMYDSAVDSILAYAAGKPINVVNPAAIAAR